MNTVKDLCRKVHEMGYIDSTYFGQFAHNGSYGDLIEFLDDNPGCLEAIYNWIAQTFPEKKIKFTVVLHPNPLNFDENLQTLEELIGEEPELITDEEISWDLLEEDAEYLEDEVRGLFFVKEVKK